MRKIYLILAIITLATCSGWAKEDNPPSVQPQYLTPKVATPWLKASVDGDKITLSDGRIFTIKKSAAHYVTAQLVMTSPVGATVTIEYEDGKDAFTAKVPFVYQTPAAKSNDYFKLTVNEGSTDKTWKVNLQHQSGEVLTIE